MASKYFEVYMKLTLEDYQAFADLAKEYGYEPRICGFVDKKNGITLKPTDDSSTQLGVMPADYVAPDPAPSSSSNVSSSAPKKPAKKNYPANRAKPKKRFFITPDIVKRVAQMQKKDPEISATTIMRKLTNSKGEYPSQTTINNLRQGKYDHLVDEEYRFDGPQVQEDKIQKYDKTRQELKKRQNLNNPWRDI